jgi:hypothetical protein
MNGRNRMLIDDLRATTADKLDGKIVERSDLGLEPDPIHEKHRDLNIVVAKVSEEGVLEG